MRLIAARFSNQSLPKLRCIFGFNHEPDGLLECGSCTNVTNGRSIGLYVSDWFHTYIVTGLFNFELFFLLLSIGVSVETIGADMGAFCMQWVWPKSNGRPQDVFGRLNMQDDDHFKCDGHEALMLYPVIAMFLRTLIQPLGYCGPQIAIVLLLCDCWDLLTALKKGTVLPDLLEAAILDHLRAYQRAYGEVGWIPKHHLATHLANMYRLFKILLCLLTQERRHKTIKRWSKDRYTLRGFERGVMEELTLEHLHAMRASWYDAGMVNPREPYSKMRIAVRSMYPNAKSILCSRRAGAVRHF